MDNQKVWFITGASKGFGLELVNQLSQLGHKVVATSRSLAELQDAAGTESESFLPLALDITDEAAVSKAIETTVSRFGRIDVVANNAGYGQLGGIEELTDAESRSNFDVNVFGTLNIIRHVLPQLRKQGSGHILNISSIAGISGNFPGWGIYCATKFAVEGLSESLATEVAPFGIKVTLVEPGYFRTNFLKSGSLRLPETRIQEYHLIRDSEAYHEQLEGNQPGDPVKGVTAIIAIADAENPPVHFLLGQDANDIAEAKIKAFQNEIATWKKLSVETAFA
ncbi:3-phenylpropionate-dihydrodiol/cinnamic acid-dihydrodiol dehydrogenase [Dyadobacter sp. CECT 9623]|uniref:3-phenylpropionate-dihydrodiol/cinnamic acid-dihydrodiol dehydrogenase n=1 Tax=Dyadobacter linearis TaxID=2823330 RepID=A0ABN7RG35_9BACT|nr:oxidoreductase [Dyadobacter sp. CECT 9623]CAG5072979.1 3-phenylpropionate-dihydrodiol/cinnamic acid-dihydrodiol dehydrogenase [Dyadobacter sp. CECT 9623]